MNMKAPSPEAPSPDPITADGRRGIPTGALRLLKALSCESRLSILCHLSTGEQTVGCLADRVRLRQATVSQHLALLRADGLVTSRREAQRIWYALAPGPTAELLAVLRDLFCRWDAPAAAPIPPDHDGEHIHER